MKIAYLNYYNHGSTGKIISSLAKLVEEDNNYAYFFCSNTRENRRYKTERNLFFVGFRWSHLFHSILSKITGFNGCFQFISTYFMIRKLKNIKPDIIHLHNLHNSYFNIPMLMKYIKKNNIKVIWTLHDCWAFTGRCPHFTLLKCNNWQSGCEKCIYPKNEYPQSIVNKSQRMWNLKKDWFTGVEQLTIVTPSKWLARLVKESFLKCYPVKVINNGIDLNVFNASQKSIGRFKRGLGKFIVLGVSFGWNYKKGLDFFITLSKKLSSNYQIVLVGTNNDIDKQLPTNIISIHRTHSQLELAEIYSSADVLFNPTREEVLGMVNVEALACGCPVVTFNTGGSPEVIDDKTGIAVPVDDVDASISAITDICENKIINRNDCIERAKMFNVDHRFKEYIELYNKILRNEEEISLNESSKK